MTSGADNSSGMDVTAAWLFFGYPASEIGFHDVLDFNEAFLLKIRVIASFA